MAKVVELLKERRQNWQELEQLCAHMENRRKRTLGAETVARFAALYRAACADLALADGYHLPPNTVQYLHRLVGRAHNQLYRSRNFEMSSWVRVLLVDVPQRIFHDRCVQVAFCLFWGIFVASAMLAANGQVWPNYAEQILGETMMAQLEENFADPIGGRSATVNSAMASFYIQHNTSIGLQCFAYSLLVIPGLAITIFNAAFLGASFGYMARPDVPEGANFFHFVTAHGPFELTAIVLSAGAGLRLGMSWIHTGGLSRLASLRRAAQDTMPLMGAAIILFFLAALIEGFLSPSAAPYWIKALVAVLSSGLLAAYFVLLGIPAEISMVQLDRTRIAIRERNLLNILDMSLRVTAAYFVPLIYALAVLVAPLMLLNWLLVGWMPTVTDDARAVIRYHWTLVLLITIQAPLASVLVTLYLGQAMFLDLPDRAEILAGLKKSAGRLLWCQLVVRGIGFSWLLAALIPRGSEFSAWDFWLFALTVYTLLFRTARPFLNEIILLERNPLRATDEHTITIARRSLALHAPHAGDLVARWLGAAGVAILLALAILLTIWFLFGVLLFNWDWGVVMIHICFPLTLWIVAGYFSVVRFLSYLDLRIRREGWEVELMMRAAANRLAGQLT